MSQPTAPMEVHATTVAIDGRGVLLRGPSGAGKSDLALRLIDSGAILIADDRTRLRIADGWLLASAPDRIQGLLEVRGVGIVELPGAAAEAPLALAVDLVAEPEAEPRMPEAAFAPGLPLNVPWLKLWPFAASAPLKVRRALEARIPVARPATAG